VRCELTGLERRLPPQVETTVFRAVQEAVHNIERHADAATAVIQTTAKDGRLWIEVEDDGAGFDAGAFTVPDGDGRGWGLLGMRERVELLGGSMRVDSAPGQGTRVELQVPLG
jgi:signal transduction histidine kinase